MSLSHDEFLVGERFNVALSLNVVHNDCLVIRNDLKDFTRRKYEPLILTSRHVSLVALHSTLDVPSAR